LLQKALPDAPFDVEFIHVTFVLDLAPRDQNVDLVAGSVAVHRWAGGAAVVDEDLSIPSSTEDAQEAVRKMIPMSREL
jgi:hypothetical protein